ncbi:DNA cytosine methyltransferase [Undibacterium sp. TC9W]|uniref:DNA cytosine methyltransferase n=1 Tax=Undibacterium sp. TC9W TaxID=3413053 RepID=UPI003BEF99D5
MKYSVAEFFSGCGGFSRGFTNSGRFNAVLGNDVKPEALRTFEFNHRQDDVTPNIILDDIRQIPFQKIDDALLDRGINPDDLDCLIGGPPCQGFSQLRRSEELENGIVKFRGYSKLAEDPRNDLVLSFLAVAEHLRPKFLVIENVPQMLNHGFNGRLGHLSETVIEMLEKDLGYQVEVGILTAANYGVPQLRERAIFIASRIGSINFPKATHADPQTISPQTPDLLPWTTVADAINDLPSPSDAKEILGGKELDQYIRGKESTFSSLMRTSKTFPFNHITRAYKSSVLDIIAEMRPGQTWATESGRMREKYGAVINSYARKTGLSDKVARKELERLGIINPSFFKDYYWSAYTRLAWNLPSLTITANANFLGSGRFTHPEESRGITMREAARLQSFDDDFRFITSKTDDLCTARIGIGMDMIGEAVPPLLAQAIATEIAAKLDNH